MSVCVLSIASRTRNRRASWVREQTFLGTFTTHHLYGNRVKYTTVFRKASSLWNYVSDTKWNCQQGRKPFIAEGVTNRTSCSDASQLFQVSRPYDTFYVAEFGGEDMRKVAANNNPLVIPSSAQQPMGGWDTILNQACQFGTFRSIFSRSTWNLAAKIEH